MVNIPTNMTHINDVFILYKISFYWYAAMDVISVVIVFLIVTCFTKEEKLLNPDCISPIMQFTLKRKKHKKTHLSSYNDVKY